MHANIEAMRRARLALEQLKSTWRARVERLSTLLAEHPDPKSTIDAKEKH